MLWDTMRCNQECREAVDKLVARYGWQLMEREEHIGRAVVHLCSGIASDAYRAAVYAYSCTLYGACSGAEGSERQNLGYSELRAYLNESASRRYSDVGEDALQRALEKRFHKFRALPAPRRVPGLREAASGRRCALAATSGAGGARVAVPDDRQPAAHAGRSARRPAATRPMLRADRRRGPQALCRVCSRSFGASIRAPASNWPRCG